MRKEIFRMDRAEAVALLERAPVVHLASTTAEGAPVLRTVHAVVVRGALAFHAAPVGEKTEAIGRDAVVGAEEIVASIPSYFLDPERACPATTLYRSAQVHGRIERVDDPAHKAEVLSALMRKLQPEGGHVPIEAEHPLYAKAVAGILVLQVSLEQLDGKAKLAQNRSADERKRLLEKLWERGLPGDPAAIELVRAANPGTPSPAFLVGPSDCSLVTTLGEADAAAAAELLADAYWNGGFSREDIARAHLGSPAWVGARDETGALVATARAIGDGTKRAWIYDVMVAPTHRGRGLGEAVMRLLLDHPALRRTRRVYLGTRDAQTFYQRMGFADRRVVEEPLRPWPTTEMVLARDPHPLARASEPLRAITEAR
jgi:nitroimidazol reductase NimA-like FMN-containing flavoprotein (pyridoxamine 5'-phosphate oxidase superfamily)/GNAT superfamily N-acetyltransferase